MTELSDKMRAFVKENPSHPRAEELRKKAQEFDDVTEAYWVSGSKKTPHGLLGGWARARRAWCEVSEEPYL